MDSATKDYSQYGSDPEKTYKSRRFSIRQRLPALTGYELQNCLENLNEEISSLQKKNEEFEGWIQRIKREGSVEAYLDVCIEP